MRRGGAEGDGTGRVVGAESAVWRLVRRVVPLTVLAIWFASLLLPVATSDPSRADAAWPGWAVLLLGAIGVASGQYGWFANLLLVPGLIVTMVERRTPIPVLLLLAGALFAAHRHVLSWDSLPVTGGGAASIEAFGVGYHLWRASLLLGAAWFLAFAAKRFLGGYGRWAQGGEFD